MEPPASFRRRWLFALFGLLTALAILAVMVWVRVPPGDGPVEVEPPVAARNQRFAVTDGMLYHSAPFARPPAPPGARNLVLVILTAVRRDALTTYGAPADAAPYIGELARNGARFDDALAASPFAGTSAVALLTGQHAATLDMVEPGLSADRRVLPDGVETLPERLRGAGWATFGIAANFNYNSETGLAQGFDRYESAPPNSFAPVLRRTEDSIVADALALFENLPEDLADRPFYLQVELLDAHPPWRSQPELEELFPPSEPNRPYRAAVRHLDDAVRSLMKALAADGHTPATDTYVVVLAEHGSGNGDPPHHGRAPGRLLYASSVRVPWVISGPDVAKNHVIWGLASLTDVSPTLLELLGLPPFAGVDGQSWAAQVRGTSDRTTRTRAFSDTWHFNVNRASVWTEGAQCQKDFGSVETVDQFETACFDRIADPTFVRPRADPALMRELEQWRATVSANVTVR